MFIIMAIVTILLGFSLGVFGFTEKAVLICFLSVNLFYIGWMIIHQWRSK